uniref:LOW QUALITY PROTEIN: protocadherin Fat 4-like n=1 Tax=Geotrypetes seraphini TaxID=260995 RepID=A0A6P8SEI3_GEOSA|nr:LOW QUALITY PROTEIN: protocadherin Fat 4-like [Geotrypetes seraphini]
MAEGVTATPQTEVIWTATEIMQEISMSVERSLDRKLKPVLEKILEMGDKMNDLIRDVAAIGMRIDSIESDVVHLKSENKLLKDTCKRRGKEGPPLTGCERSSRARGKGESGRPSASRRHSPHVDVQLPPRAPCRFAPGGLSGHHAGGAVGSRRSAAAAGVALRRPAAPALPGARGAAGRHLRGQHRHAPGLHVPPERAARALRPQRQHGRAAHARPHRPRAAARRPARPARALQRAHLPHRGARGRARPQRQRAVFPDASVRVAFREDAAGARQVLLDTATDADAGANGVDHRSYRLARGNELGLFGLDVTLNPSGHGAFLHLVSRGALDRERAARYQLLLEVEDGGEPRRRGQLLINVTVTDANDNAPAFERAQYRAQVAEDAAPGASVLSVGAADADEGANAEVRYELVEEEGGAGAPFHIDARTGLVTVREALDFESRRQYTLSLRATDGGAPPLSGRAEALVRLTDVNDNDPVVRFPLLPCHLTLRLRGRERAGWHRGGPAHRHRCRLGRGQRQPVGGHSGRQRAGPLRGAALKVPNLSLVKVAHALDRERIPHYNLTVAVSDGGRPRPRSSVASLVIYINDVNDHPPEFEHAVYRAQVREDLPVGSYVHGLAATDGDSGPNAHLRYAIVAGNELGWFTISERTGLVTSCVLLDREAATEVALNISAQDRGPVPRVSYAQLLITILDVNDQAPTFSHSAYSLALPENSPAGTPLLVLQATDNDLGDNGTVRYIFEPDTAALAAWHRLPP